MNNSLIAGCGNVGISLGRQLVQLGHEVWGIRRNTALLPPIIHPICADLTEQAWAEHLPPRLDFVFYLASSDGRNEVSYRRAYLEGPRNVLEILRRRNLSLRRFFFISSTGVYAQKDGEWVTEESSTEPDHFPGQILLSGESTVLKDSFPSTVVRFSGIYGPDRSRLLSRVARGEEACVKGLTLFTNRIHRDDCGGILTHLTTLKSPEEIYLGVDHEPVDRCTLIRWLAEELGAPPPAQTDPSEISSRRMRSNKRCSNQRIVDSGYRFSYPTFREGYAPLVRLLKDADVSSKSQ